MREQIQNERDNAAAYGNTEAVEKFDRLLGVPPEPETPAQKRAAALDKQDPPAVRPRVDQRRPRA